MSELEQEQEPLILIEFSEEQGGDIVLENQKDVNKWVENEHSVWSWLTESPHRCNDNQVNASNQHFYNTIMHLKSQVESIKDGENARVEDVRNIIDNLRGYAFFHSKSLKAHLIKEVFELYGMHPAYAALSFAANKPFTANIHDSLLGVSTYISLLSGLSVSSNKAALNAFEESRRRAVGRFSSLNQKADKLIEGLDNSINDDKRRADVLTRWAQSRWDSYKSQKNNQVKQSLESISKTEKAYKEFMKLKAPVEYWNKKSGEHKDAAKGYRELLVAYFPLSLIFTLYFVYACGLFVEAKGEDFIYVAATLTLVLTTTFLWIGKLLVRLYLSEHHLSIDAGERAIMAQSYLALINDGQVSPQHIEAVLAALFRPTADGIVKDDAAPGFTLQNLITGGKY